MLNSLTESLENALFFLLGREGWAPNLVVARAPAVFASLKTDHPPPRLEIESFIKVLINKK